MKNEQEEMTEQEFKEDPYAGYGLTHLDIVDTISDRILKLNILAVIIGILGIVLTASYGYTSVASMFLGIYIGIGFLSVYLVRVYEKSEYTKFRKVNVTDGKKPEK